MLAIMFCIGSFLWPSLGGAAMDRFGPDAMPVSLVAAYALFLAVMVAVRLRAPAPEARA